MNVPEKQHSYDQPQHIEYQRKNQAHGQQYTPYDPTSTDLNVAYSEAKYQQEKYQSNQVISPVKQEGYEGMGHYEGDHGEESSLERNQKPCCEVNPNHVLQELLPLFGSVPIVMYFPGASQAHLDLISANGGQVTNIVECFTY